MTNIERKTPVPWLFVALWAAAFVWDSTTVFIWTTAVYIIFIIIGSLAYVAEKERTKGAEARK